MGDPAAIADKPRSTSLVERLVAKHGAEKFRASLSSEEAENLPYLWDAWARPEQMAPTIPWSTWVVLAGRGFGKTRTGSQWVRERIESGKYGRGALIAATASDAREVLVEGESGILAVSPPNFRPVYEPSKRRLTYPNGAILTTYSAEEPDRLRGPQHDFGWGDEFAAWKYLSAWDMFEFGLRLGPNPCALVTTTPRPIPELRKLLAEAGTVFTRGSTFDNAANLPQKFLKKILSKYGGTRLGRQELNAEILDDVPGALWTREMLERARTAFYAKTGLPILPEMKRIVVAIDPAATAEEGSDETGIIGAGKGIDSKGYVLEDRSCRLPPADWAKRAIALYYELDADLIVAEVNNGGDMVESVIHTVDPKVPVKKVRASRGKAVRAEPISSLYEQNRVKHAGHFGPLEDQMTQMTNDGYSGTGSPDRLDAAVWALTELLLGVNAVFV